MYFGLQSYASVQNVIRLFIIFGWLRLIVSHNIVNLINYNDIRMKPIFWDDKAVIFDRDGQHLRYRLNTLTIKDTDIFTSQFFYIGSDKEYFVIVNETAILLVNSSDGTINDAYSVIEPDLIYAPLQDDQNLLAFKQIKASDRIENITLLTIVNLNGTIVKKTQSVSIDPKGGWKFMSMFLWNQEIFAGFQHAMSIVILRIKSFSSETKKLENVISAIKLSVKSNITLDAESLSNILHFIPIYSEPLFVYPYEIIPTGIQYYGGELIPLFNALDSKIDECRKGIISDNLYRLDKFLANSEEIKIGNRCRDQIPFISVDGELYFTLNKSIPRQTLFFLNLGHEVARIRLIYILVKSPDTIPLIVCDFILSDSSDKYKMENCRENNIGIKTQNFTKSPSFAIDEKEGSVRIGVHLGEDIYRPYEKIPVIHCEDFNSCPTCKLSRYILNCKWVNSSCSTGQNDDYCFGNLEAKIEQGEGLMKLVGQIPYTFKSQFGDRVVVNVDRKKLRGNYSGNYFEVYSETFTAEKGLLIITRDPNRKRNAGMEEKLLLLYPFDWIILILIILPPIIFIILIECIIICRKCPSANEERTKSSTGTMSSDSSPSHKLSKAFQLSQSTA